MEIDAAIMTIRNATTPDATSAARQAGATACRALLAALEGSQGEPPAPVTQISPTAIANALATFRSLPTDQLLDIAIAKLRSALPDGVEPTPGTRLTFNIASIPRLITSGGLS